MKHVPEHSRCLVSGGCSVAVSLLTSFVWPVDAGDTACYNLDQEEPIAAEFAP